jgi:TfoX/Sxy family transcriptional regulator of competence genes
VSSAPPEPDPRREILDRIEQRLPPGAVREVAMFGAIAVMLDDAMVVAVSKDQSLLVRVAPEEAESLLSRPEAVQATMGSGTRMGAGWIRVDADAAAEDAQLDFWVAAAVRRRAQR